MTQHSWPLLVLLLAIWGLIFGRHPLPLSRPAKIALVIVLAIWLVSII
jgi:hypothetical protein